MLAKGEIKLRNNQNYSNQTKQAKAWPKAYNPFIVKQKTFPKDWSQFSLNS